MKVLVLEDDADIRLLLQSELEHQGLSVTGAASVAEAREALRHRDFNIAALDLTLPDGSGLEILDDLRRSGSSAHVIVMSGHTTEKDRVRALHRGADDYVVKPFSLLEFTARVLAARRRLDPAGDATLKVGDLEIDLVSRHVSVRAQPVAMTCKEFDLLAFLAARPGVTFSREDLLRSVWDSAPDWQLSSTVTEHVRRLRSKIEQDPRNPTLLVTVRGIGYRLDLPALGAPAAGARTGTVIHIDSRIVSADRDAVLTLGGAADTIVVGKHLLDFVAPESRGAAERRAQLGSAGAAPRSELMVLRRIDGSTFAAEVSSCAAEWEGLPATSVTITPSVDPPAMLRHLVTGIATEVSDAVIVADLHSHVRSWNAGAARLYGWTEGEAVGRHILDVLRTPAADDQSAQVWEALEVTGHWHGELQHLTRDGSTIQVLASVRVVGDEGVEPLGVISVMRLARPETADLHEESTELATQIREGIDNNQFEVFYQPVVELGNEMICLFEALVRWNHPTRGLLEAGEFIEVAEASGLINELGHLVLEPACHQAAAWRRDGFDIEVAVNLSAVELSDSSLPRQVADVLQRSGLEASSLWLEVTETSVVQDVAEVCLVLERLAALGVRIALDDFGTGWASLTYLNEFPVHALKIDRSFIEEISHSANSVAIARSILELGDELDLFVVAEGVETPEQQAIVAGLGCSLAQGFLFGRPTPAHDAPIHRAKRINALTRSELRPNGNRRTVPRRVTQSAGGASPGPAAARGADAEVFAETASDAVASMLRALLHVTSEKDAIDLLHRAVRTLGGTLVPATSSVADTLPIDVSLGEGPPVVLAVEPFSVARMQLERLLPGLVDDTRRALDLLRQRYGVEPESDGVNRGSAHSAPTGALGMESRLAAIVESSADAIIGKTLDGVITSWNASAERMYGYTADEIVGCSISLIIPPERSDELAAIMQRVRQGGPVQRFDTTQVCKDGSTLDVSVAVSPVRDARGVLIGASTVARDITDAKLTVNALLASEARKTAMLEAAIDAVISIDEHGLLVEFNPAAERVFGYSRAAVIGQPMADIIVPPGLREQHRAGLARYLETGEARVLGRRLELTAQRADGTEFPIELAITKVDVPGPPLFTAYVRDVTEQHRQRADLQALNDRQHQSDRLESLGQLAGGIAHDFNNILAAIMNYAEFVADETADRPSVLADVHQIRTAAERAALLTNQLLIFARRDAVQPVALDLNSVVEEIHNLLSRSIGEHISLRLDTATNLPNMRADRGQIEQVLLNLAVNARDAMPDGGTLTIATTPVDLDEDYAGMHPEASAGHYVGLVVSDTGTGMSADVAARIFEPFFTTKPVGEGTGLGLATVYGIIREAGGTMTVYSEPGIGSTFRLYFPVTDLPASASPIDTTACLRGNGEIILVVEDEPAVLQLTSRILRQSGYTVLEAATFQEALSHAANHDFHLLLTDSVMPAMSGRMLAERINELRPGRSVLYMSGYSEGVLGPRRPLENGVTLIQKPFNRRTLLDNVAASLLSHTRKVDP